MIFYSYIHFLIGLSISTMITKPVCIELSRKKQPFYHIYVSKFIVNLELSVSF
jgi:hypothetical protein